jgi:hypothetical protein
MNSSSRCSVDTSFRMAVAERVPGVRLQGFVRSLMRFAALVAARPARIHKPGSPQNTRPMQIIVAQWLKQNPQFKALKGIKGALAYHGSSSAHRAASRAHPKMDP